MKQNQSRKYTAAACNRYRYRSDLYRFVAISVSHVRYVCTFYIYTIYYRVTCPAHITRKLPNHSAAPSHETQKTQVSLLSFLSMIFLSFSLVF